MSTTSTPERTRASDGPAAPGGLAARLSGPEPRRLAGGSGWPVFPAVTEARLRAYVPRDVDVRREDGAIERVPLAVVLDALAAGSCEVDLYLRDQRLSDLDPQLWQLVPREVRRLNWLLALPEPDRPDWAWLLVGTAGTSTPVHVDTMASSAWNLLCAGEKRWTFSCPHRAEALGLLPPGLHAAEPCEHADEYVFTQRAGDLMVTPAGWAHGVTNTEGTISVTANFINQSNLTYAIRYFEHTDDDANASVLRELADTFAQVVR